MNANGSDFLLLHGPRDFATEIDDAFDWDPRSNVLRMSQQDTPRTANLPRSQALVAWAGAAPLGEDNFGQLGMLNSDATELHYSLVWPPTDTNPVRVTSESGTGTDTVATTLDPVSAPTGATFADLHIGETNRAALPYSNGTTNHGITVVDLARRWQDRFALPAAALRVWVDPHERIWAANDTILFFARGGPLPQPYYARRDRFEPIDIEPDPLRLVWQRLLPAGWQLLALAADTDYLFVLMWQESSNSTDHRQMIVRRALSEDADVPFDLFQLPPHAPFSIDLRAVAPDQLALMIPRDPTDTDFRNCDLPIVALDFSSDGVPLIRMVPRRYPQPSQAWPRFVAVAGPAPRIITGDGPRGLWPLPQVRYPAGAEAVLTPPLDSGTPGTQWHRICLDGCIPAGCSLRIDARAFDSDEPTGRWQEQPVPVWSPLASELSFHASRYDPIKDHEGLFDILLQRDDGPVRQLAGRRLQLRLRLTGDGRHSPSIAAMRVYLPRASWQEAYLPTHFRQHAVAVDIAGPANGADLRERLLASLEGMLTPIEDRVAAAEAWLSPFAAPQDHLNRLAGLVGGTAPAHWSDRQRRRWVAATGELQRTKGTLIGLCLALDILTDGAVARGQVVPVENYRLRRTMATILGLDLDDRDHPLTLGSGQSGNSIVGPTLILSDETSRDFLALFAPELARSTGDAKAVKAFFDRYAHRLSVVVHGPARALVGTIDEALAAHVPAGVQWKILETDQPFVLGLSPLLGIDTLLEENAAWRKVVLEDTFLGREGILQSPPALAPEFINPLVESLRGDAL